jgi:8-oxo-dGTP pyrophosphatase MutT (NUDIX family)
MENVNIESHKKIYCVNCGECGHVIKNCKGPITSFGVIIFKIVKNEKEEKNDIPNNLKSNLYLLKSNKYISPFKKVYPKIKFLMIQRKDTMSYIDFLRGKYPLEEPEKTQMLKVQFSEMTKDERQSLEKLTFDELWENLWINKSSRLYKNEKMYSKNRYLEVNIKELLETTKSNWELQEFGFPKGRRNIKETNVACAEREFFEETGYEKQMYQFIKDFPIVDEEFLATNNVVYKHKYYLLKLKEEFIDYIPELSQTQECEVKSVGWYTIDECLTLIRNYDDKKKEIIQNVYENIITMENNYELSDFYYYNKKYKLN